MTIRQTKLVKGNPNIDAIHMENQFKVRQDANDIIEDMFTNACLKKASKDDKSKE